MRCIVERMTLLAAMVLLAGCNIDLRPSVPKGAEWVGGGEIIQYVAPADGTIYLTSNNTLLMTKTVTKGEAIKLEGNVPMGNGGSWTLSKARLYFQPATGVVAATQNNK